MTCAEGDTDLSSDYDEDGVDALGNDKDVEPESEEDESTYHFGSLPAVITVHPYPPHRKQGWDNMLVWRVIVEIWV